MFGISLEANREVYLRYGVTFLILRSVYSPPTHYARSRRREHRGRLVFKNTFLCVLCVSSEGTERAVSAQ